MTQPKITPAPRRRESLRKLLRDLIAHHGAPSANDIKWAERALEQPRA